MKILYVGVFDDHYKSTNNSQYNALVRLGHQVFQYNYRTVQQEHGDVVCNERLLECVTRENFDLVLISKGSMPNAIVTKMCNFSIVGLWYMDPLVATSFSVEVQERCKLVRFVCCDKLNVLNECLKLNPHSYHACEGYDRDVDYPAQCEQGTDVSLIGEPYGYRLNFLRETGFPVRIIQGAYGRDHAIVVSKSKINLNFVTEAGASDRVYKIMAAEGFLLTNDWVGREKMFVDGEHLVLFDTPVDLRNKIHFYLKNEELRNRIAKSGYTAVQPYNRDAWAISIIEAYKKCKDA